MKKVENLIARAETQTLEDSNFFDVRENKSRNKEQMSLNARGNSKQDSNR
jgi:hypothetical protein